MITDKEGREEKRQGISEREDLHKKEREGTKAVYPGDRESDPLIGNLLVDTNTRNRGKGVSCFDGQTSGLTHPIKATMERAEWAYEIEDNSEGYAKLQADIVVLRNVIMGFQGERSQTKVDKVETGAPGNPYPPSRVDLALGLSRPSMGPEQLELIGDKVGHSMFDHHNPSGPKRKDRYNWEKELEYKTHLAGRDIAGSIENWANTEEDPEPIEQVVFVKEDIGLREPVVIRDYPSPPDTQHKHTPIILSREDILKCKQACEADLGGII